MSDPAQLTFQFWDDKQYQSYEPDVQHLLNAQLYVLPRPTEIRLPGDRYVIRNFELVEHGHAFQGNLLTGFKRHLRVQPPYAMPGVIPGTSALAGTCRFQYNDSGWHDFAPELNMELQMLARCVPAPAQALFTMQGKAYWLHGLESLALGNFDDLSQTNARTGFIRRVRAIPLELGAAAASSVDLPSSPSTTPSPFAAVPTSTTCSSPTAAGPAGWAPSSAAAIPKVTLTANRRPRASGYGGPVTAASPRGVGRGRVFGSSGTSFSSFAESSSSLSSSRRASVVDAPSTASRRFSPAHAPEPPPRRSRAGLHNPVLSTATSRAATRPGKSVWSCAEFRIDERGGSGRFERLAPEAQAVLREALQQPAREDRVMLPSGAVVEGFTRVELDGAGCRNAAAGWMPLELVLPMPSAGSMVLPDDLDEDEEVPLSSFGRPANLEDLSEAFPEEGGPPECAICRGEMTAASVDDNMSGGGSSSSSSCGNGCEPRTGIECATCSAASDAAGSRAFRLQCEHIYHEECLQRWFQQKRRCPQCQTSFGKVIGAQPRSGKMSWRTEAFQVAGHPKARETIVLEFEFPPGLDDAGAPYLGRKQKGYLPGDCQGILLLELFKVAFKRRVMFGLGLSMSYGTYRPTFNIHLKTSFKRGGTEHGFPDDEYYTRSLDELRANGVTMADLAS